MRDMAAKGRHFSKTTPERIRRGDAHYYRQRPTEIRRGEEIGNAVLTESSVRAVRAAHRAGATMKELAERFGIGTSQASRITRYLSWKHVT